MADTKNNEVAPDSGPAAVQTAAPVTVVRERRGWAYPLIAALIIVAALVVGGIGGFAIARVTDHRDGPPMMQEGQFPGGGRPDQSGPGQGQLPGQNGPGGQNGQQVGPPQGGQNGSAPTPAPTNG